MHKYASELRADELDIDVKKSTSSNVIHNSFQIPGLSSY
jgi:hypothetical protein